MKASMVTMAMTFDGYRIDQTLGVVRGIVVRSRSLLGTLGAALQTIRGGNITIRTELCERTRADAFEQMIRHAEELGATGVICVRYDATEVMQGVQEVLCYGTAVRMSPVVAAA
ncbi:MAG: YbjQ family protein [Gemmatimonadaceae bacterium]|nr:YbjQ family protein [Gemmatimonadaceae bacterium]